MSCKGGPIGQAKISPNSLLVILAIIISLQGANLFEYPRNLIFLPVAILVLAVLPLPYGYYGLVRVLTSIVAAWFIFIEFDKNKAMTGWAWIWACVLVLFNPIIPIHLTRFIWFFFDLGTAGLMYVYARPKPATNDQRD